MKLEQIIERTFDAATGEVIDDSPHDAARMIAKQIVQAAQSKASEGYGPDVVAKKMAQNFHQALLAAIEEELKMSKAKQYSEYGPSGRSRGHA